MSPPTCKSRRYQHIHNGDPVPTGTFSSRKSPKWPGSLFRTPATHADTNNAKRTPHTSTVDMDPNTPEWLNVSSNDWVPDYGSYGIEPIQ
jgi:hypothetical protein